MRERIRSSDIGPSDNAELQQSTALGAKGIFRRFVFVLVVFEVIVGVAVLTYDILDTTASMNDKLESLATVGMQVVQTMRTDSPETSNADLLCQAAKVTGFPMGLIAHGG
ncbi:MAG TPA: hypothetical protein PKW66_09750, partial [Polyangiaceae bacterium]|nr:hypothetical protein [Polyangiaceae bacterium]